MRRSHSVQLVLSIVQSIWNFPLHLALQFAALVGVAVTLSVLVLRIEFNEVVDTKDRDGCLGGKLKRLELRDGRLEDTCLTVIPHRSFVKVQPDPTN